ncbi:hypothetical protein PT974_10480 [Cladobotryum mycophilum]|uniref:Cysteine-rich transmembrane CYSTM domain-containing protein n=1 Tax=Cladobotryum mycophilum TaxID=491253 RepID=A0ABR0SAV7_9HYPO
MPSEQMQMPEQPMTAQVAAPRTSSEQPRAIEPMSVESGRMRGGGEGEAICCGVCAGLCCFECCECCC